MKKGEAGWMELSWEELLELAVRMEETGRDIYRSLAAGVKDPETERTLMAIAEEEEEHAAVFRHGLPGASGPLPEEAVGYLEDLGLSSRVPPGIERPDQALALALEMEKDSIQFYTKFAALARDEQARRILHGILRAEELHLMEMRERFEEEG